MKKEFIIALSTIALLGIATSCSDNNDVTQSQSNIPEVIQTTANGDIIIEGNNRIGFKLIKEIGESQEYIGKNIILSPISVNYAMSMLANGANGETRQEIIDTFGYGSVDIEELNDYNRKMIYQLSNIDPNVTVNFANSIWAKPQISIKNDFITSVNTYYDADYNKINNSTFIDDVNKWCSDKTNGKISNFVEREATIPEFALYNAIYFKGIWDNESKFSKINTKEDYFNNINGTRSIAQFMHKKGNVSYSETEYSQICELLFGRSNYRAAFILPKTGVTTNDVVDELVNEGWCNQREISHDITVKLSLPKFNIESEVRLTDLLVNLGMPSVFGNDADYSLLSDDELYVTTIKQKDFFAVDEDGVEAAAVTGISMEASPAAGTEIDVKFNRPFIFIVYEYTTNTIIFIGQINAFAE